MRFCPFTCKFKRQLIPIVLAVGCTMSEVNAQTQEIEVGLEPAPPLITEDGKGQFVDALRSIEKQLDVHFHINIVTFSRAKHDLKTGQMQMIGMTNYRSEGEEFYNFANELDWFINAAFDIYTLDDRHLELAQLIDTGVIGTPSGNVESMAEMLHIPQSRFYTSHLKNLILMLKAKRIDALIFERASTMTTIKALGISGVRYQKVHDDPGSLALRRDANLDKLKPRLENALISVSKQRTFKHFYDFYNLPDTGIITPDPTTH
jgi:polar amino acid transport system substrate-binding protein